MHTIGSFFALALVGWLCNRSNNSDRGMVSDLQDNEIKALILHARQDIKLLAFLLGLVIIMLGIIADKT